MEFKLRPFTIQDLPSLVQYAGNYKVARYMTDKFPHPYTEDAGRAFIDFASTETPVRIFAIDVKGKASGGIGIHPQADIYRRNAELGYWLAEPFWGNKIMSRAIRQAVDFAFETFDIERVFARPFGNNAASQKVLEANKFKLEARLEKVLYKNGEYLDELIYAVRRADWCVNKK